MAKSDIRVRIAPSPSWFLHVGVARTAIFNWIYARSQGGTFILRIEDTDADRSLKEMADSIVNTLKWLGLDWDEGPYFQTERIDIHKKHMDRLLQCGKAYCCFCTTEELAAKRKKAKKNKADHRYDRTCLKLSKEEVRCRLEAGEEFVLRLKIPEGETGYSDMIYGPMLRQNKDIEDFVICRRNGHPLYNFAVVVDDHEMGITDIFRGNDHQTNTFKQVLIYQALGLPIPRIGHLPLIFDKHKKKISKRDRAANASDYGKLGFLPEAVFNYLSLLGWSPKDDREILSRNELIRIFDVKGTNKANSIFDSTKMEFINGEHIKRLSNHDLAMIIAPRLVEAGIKTRPGLDNCCQYLMDVVGLLKSRCNLLTEFVERSKYFFQEPQSYDEKGMNNHFTPEMADWLMKLANHFEELDQFTHDNLEQILKNLAEQLDINVGKLIHPTRLAVSGMTTGPGLYEMLEVIGKDVTVARVHKAARLIREKATDES